MVGCHPTSAWACRFVPENQSQDRLSSCPLILSVKALTTTMRNCACGVCHSLRLRTHRSACADLLSANAAPPPETLAVSHPHPASFSTEPECATPTTSRLSAAAALRNSASLVGETSSRCRHHNSHPSMLMYDGNDHPAVRAVKWKHARSMNPYHQPIFCQVQSCMCSTSRWHSAKPSETTPFAPVAPSALLRCCGNTIRLLNSGPAAHRPALLNARDSLSRSSGHGRGTLEARARLDSVIHCLKNR